MSDLQQALKTTLETINKSDMHIILNEKLIATSPEMLCDYIGFATMNLDDNIIKLKEYKKELDKLIAKAQSQKEDIGIEAASFLEDAGIDKLDGVIVSSITTRQQADTVKLVIEDEEECIKKFGKVVLDKTALKNAILDGVEVAGASVDVMINARTIRVNKRK